MIEALSILGYSFLACILLILIHTYFGIHILRRGIIFVDLSLAQFIGVGIAISFLLPENSFDRYLFSMIFALIGASILSLSRQIARFINIEAFIGALYIFSFALSILILDRSPHGLEEFKVILNGNIVWVSPAELFSTFIIYGIVGLLHFIFRDRFTALSYEGKGTVFWEFLFFFSFAIVLVKSVILAGILQVFSFLVIPALIGRLYTAHLIGILVIGWVIGFSASLFGIVVSYKLDLPTAPLIVASLCAVFFLQLLIKALRSRKGSPDCPVRDHSA